MKSTLVLAALQGALALAIPIALPAQAATHQCSVIVQRWEDNSFDIYDYAFAPAPNNIFNSEAITTAESIDLSNGQQLPPTTIGSHALSITNVANPAGADPNTDPGKLNFGWGNQSWSSTSSKCVVVPRGDQGGAEGAATTYTCTFTCDA